ncbi:hypothetical protein IQ274_24645 [Nostoc sp. LEGE 12447]|uniref:hypothetical protein n=1 Tax=Nostoc sp. LEGE 12447 TaxID=1828640 RepID=UPI001883310B|nr:hypothetical protein [Nostoc sp. LEGE 12447]MBE9001319.1 hypothetical protein [Nostoc sp. LEGE 12447]
MKKAIFTTITLILCPMLIASCSDGNSTSQQNKVNQANTATTTLANSANKEKLNNIEVGKKISNPTSNEKTHIKNNKPNEIPHNNPILGTIKDMQNGDLKCYVTVLDENGKLYEGIGATFEVCEPEKYVNKKVKMSYGLENVSDCQSSEPCGKTIKEWLITNIEIHK